MSVLKLTQEDFEKTAGSDLPTVVDFWAPWCNPCTMMAPVFEELSENFDGKAQFCKVNIDEEPELAEQYSVMSIPTLAVFKNGTETARSVGLMSLSDTEKFIAQNI